MQIDLGLALLLVRCLMLMTITITLGSYHDPSARKRWLVSIMAVCAAGSSFGWALYSFLMAASQQSCISVMDEFWPTLFVMCALIPVLYTRGNLAKLLPRIPWSVRP